MKAEIKSIRATQAGAAAGAPIENAGYSFETIEGSHAFVAQLLDAIETTAAEVGEDLKRTKGVAGRGREALQLIAYKLEQLSFHLATSRRRLDDLRTLRDILYAGASSLLVSLWPVSDAAASGLVVDLYRELLAGRPKAQALREAKLRTLGRNPEYAKPYYWSSLVLVGERERLCPTPPREPPSA